MEKILQRISEREQYFDIINNAQKELKEYIKSNNLKSLVIGISGGVDSAICAALARPVCDDLGIPLIGRSITIESNKIDERLRAEKVGKCFCTDFVEVDFTENYLSILPIYQDSNDKITLDKESLHNEKVRLGNIKARMRMIYLYDLSQKNNGMVLDTDNLTEHYMGFWTINGDDFDYSMIQYLWKSEVYELTRVFASQFPLSIASRALLDCVDAVPTDGLGITNSDLDQLGADTYQDVDDIIIKHFSKYKNTISTLKQLGEIYSESSVEYKVLGRMIRSEFKRKMPISISRETLLNH